MVENEQMSNLNFIMLWGFILFVLGAIGAIQIGILEGLIVIIISGGLLMIIGVMFLCYLAIIDKLKS